MDLYLFYIEDCVWCEWLKTDVIKYIDLLPEYQHVNVFRINGKDIDNIYKEGMTGDEVADKYGVYLYPTVIVVESREELVRTIGVASMDEYWYNLDLILLKKS